MTTVPQLNNIQKVRFLLGDSDPDAPYLDDIEISYGLSEKGGSVRSAAAYLARRIAARLSLQMQPYQLADYREADGGKVAKMYLDLARQLEADVVAGGASAGIYAGGMRKSDKAIDEGDPDMVHPSFKRGLHDWDSGAQEDDPCSTG